MEGVIAAAALAGFLIDGPFEIGVDQGHVGSSADGKGAAVEAEEFGGVLRVELDETREVNGGALVDEDVEEQPEFRFEAEDAEGGLVEFNFLFVTAMRRVVAGEDGDRAVGDAGDEG